MKQKFFKYFWAWEYEKEIQWINDMAAKGFALCHVGLCTYWFEDSEPGEYVYGMEWAEHAPSSAEGRKYLDFLADCGTEFVSNWLNWIYVRRKKEDGPLDLHNDLDSRIAHLRRVFLLLLPVILLNLWAFILNVFIGLRTHQSGNVIISSVNLFIAIPGSAALIRLARQIHRLKKERQLHE